MSKFLFEKYRICSIWFCIAILALTAVVFSNDTHKELCILLIFFLAGGLYGMGALREWDIGRRWLSFLQSVLMLMCLAAFVMQSLRMGGVIS